MNDNKEIKRVVIIHVHMFKNAGTTFDWSLNKNFGDSFIDHRDDAEMRKGAKYLGPFLEKNYINAISSHHIKLPLPDSNKLTLLPVFILRNPIDRIGSVYAFEKKNKSNSLGAIMAKKMPFKDFVSWYMEMRNPASIRDFQTRYCTGNIGTNRPMNEKDYQYSLKQLHDTSLVGIVDLYDKSMVVFEQTLKSYFPSIDLSYIKQNINKRQQKTLEDRISDIKNDLGKELLPLVMENNKFDLMLYNEAKKLVISRASKISDFDNKLENLKKRNLGNR